MERHIGADESGKGDYFGYLVIAGVVVDDESEKKLREIGVKDSKMLSDSVVTKLSAAVKRTCGESKFNVVRISPEKYNTLQKKFKNLNALLAWGHAQVIENLLQKNNVDYIIVDKFADEKYMNDALAEKEKRGKIKQKVKLIQNIRGESDMAVAAASIIARTEFLRTLKQLSMEVGYSLPKGATHVEEAARELVKKYDESVLNFTAKKHFKTTKRVLGK